MRAGQFEHASIASAPRRQSECAVGWIAHYVIGGVFGLAFVALVPADWLARLKSLMSHGIFGLGLYLSAVAASHLPWAAT